MPENQSEIDSILNMTASAYGKKITFRELLLKVDRQYTQEIIDGLYESALQEGMVE